MAFICGEDEKCVHNMTTMHKKTDLFFEKSTRLEFGKRNVFNYFDSQITAADPVHVLYIYRDEVPAISSAEIFGHGKFTWS